MNSVDLREKVFAAVEANNLDDAFRLAAIWEAFFRYGDTDGLKVDYDDLPSVSEIREIVAFVKRNTSDRGYEKGTDKHVSTYGLDRLADKIEGLALRGVGEKEADAVEALIGVLKKGDTPDDQLANELLRVLRSRNR